MSQPTKKKDLLDLLADLNGTNKRVVQGILKDFQKTVLLSLKETGEAKLLDLGKLRVAVSKEREAKNPRNGQIVFVPAKKVPKFSFSKKVKEFVASDEKYPDFEY